MAAASTVAQRRERLTNICLALPEATGSSRTGQHSKFEVRGKTFAYYVNDHHGDGRIALTCKVPPGMQSALIASAARFYMPAYLGPKGWVALRLDGRSIDWAEVEELVRESYRLIAPKRLAATVE